MSDVYLPETNHVVRYIKPSLFNNGEISGEAFQLRKDERDGLSVNWLEYFGDIPKDHQLANVRRSIGIDIKSTGRFAELAIGKTQQFLKDDSDCEARFVHRPLKASGSQKEDPSHSVIVGLPLPEASNMPEMPDLSRRIGNKIAEYCVEAIFPGLLRE